MNFIFPTQSDDIGRKIEGIGRAVQSYMTWNGRFGELLLVTFGSFFSTTPFYAFEMFPHSAKAKNWIIW